MRVLIIRPEKQAMRTAKKLADLGHDPVIFPLFRPLHDLAMCREALAIPHSAIAVTSQEAIRCLENLGGDLAPVLDTPVFAVGSATTRLAREVGFSNVITAGGSGRELAAMVAGFNVASASGHPVLYLAGVKRSSAFEDSMREHDLSLVTAEIYDMESAHPGLEQQQSLLVDTPVDAVFLFSRENARAFLDLEVFRQSNAALRKTLFFCLSRNIAECVPEEFRNSAVVSLTPDEDELIDLL